MHSHPIFYASYATSYASYATNGAWVTPLARRVRRRDIKLRTKCRDFSHKFYDLVRPAR